MSGELPDFVRNVVAQLERDASTLNEIVHGADDATVTTDGGEVSTAAKAVKSIEGMLRSELVSIVEEIILDEEGRWRPERMPSEIQARLQLLGGTIDELESIQPVPMPHELLVETDSGGSPLGVRIGDGLTPAGVMITEGIGGVGGGFTGHVPGTIRALYAMETPAEFNNSSLGTDGSFYCLLPTGDVLSGTFVKPQTVATDFWSAPAPFFLTFYGAHFTKFRMDNNVMPVMLDFTGCSLVEISMPPLFMMDQVGLMHMSPLPSSLNTLVLEGTLLTHIDLGPMVATAEHNGHGGFMKIKYSNNSKCTSIRAAGIEAVTNTDFGASTFDFSNNMLSRFAVEKLIADLPPIDVSPAVLSLDFRGNPGYSEVDSGLAENKGYNWL